MILVLLSGIIYADEKTSEGEVFTVLDSEKFDNNIIVTLDIPAERINQECQGDVVCIREKVNGFIAEERILLGIGKRDISLFSVTPLGVGFTIIIPIILILITLIVFRKKIKKRFKRSSHQEQ